MAMVRLYLAHGKFVLVILIYFFEELTRSMNFHPKKAPRLISNIYLISKLLKIATKI